MVQCPSAKVKRRQGGQHERKAWRALALRWCTPRACQRGCQGRLRPFLRVGSQRISRRLGGQQSLLLRPLWRRETKCRSRPSHQLRKVRKKQRAPSCHPLAARGLNARVWLVRKQLTASNSRMPTQWSRGRRQGGRWPSLQGGWLLQRRFFGRREWQSSRVIFSLTAVLNRPPLSLSLTHSSRGLSCDQTSHYHHEAHNQSVPVEPICDGACAW